MIENARKIYEYAFRQDELKELVGENPEVDIKAFDDRSGRATAKTMCCRKPIAFDFSIISFPPTVTDEDLPNIYNRFIKANAMLIKKMHKCDAKDGFIL